MSEINAEEQFYSTDHVKLAEIYSEREELEDRMLALMEFLEDSGEEY